MTRTDMIVVFLAVALLPFLYLRYWGEGDAGESVRILAGDKTVKEFSLTENRQVTVQGPLGPSILEIRDGKVRFIASPCSGKQCVHAGWLHQAGEIAACLPNRISITVAGRNPRYDAINF